MTRTLITGSAGFVGRHIVAVCQERGDDVVACDLKDGWDCRELFHSDGSYFDLIFHCAATVGGREGIDYNAAFLAADNFEIDGAMWRWALDTKPGRVIYFSSAASYAIQKQYDPPSYYKRAPDDPYIGWGPMPEDAIDLGDYFGAPDESYGWAKLMGEMVAERVRKAGIPVTVVRPFSSYDFDQDDCYPFPEFVRRAARRDDPFVVWGDGTQVRDWIHVDDLVAALLVLVEAEADGPVNLGTGVGTSMDELANLCMETAGYEAPILHLTDKPTGVHYRVCDNAKLLRYYEPQITIREGVRRALGAVCV